MPAGGPGQSRLEPRLIVHDLLPFLLIGITVGSAYGLAATGLVLTYKTTGIFNFAQGAVAALAVFIFYWLHDQNNVPWPLAAAICIFVAGPIMGMGLELLGRRLADADPTLQVAATAGVMLWVVAVGNIWFANVPDATLPQFLPTSTFGLGGVNITWADLVVVVVSLAGAAVLYAFLQYSRRGRAMRSIVDDPNLLAMTGARPTSVRRQAWIIGSMFAAISGLLLAPSLPLDAVTLTLLVVQSFGAAAAGYFSNLPLTYLGGLLVGIAGAFAVKYVAPYPSLAGIPAALPFIILFIALLAMPRSKLALRRFVVPRPIPVSWQAPIRGRILAGVIAIALLSCLPAIVGTNLPVFSTFLALSILVLSLGFLIRTSRQISLCQYAFAAIGAAAMAHFTSGFGIPWVPALLLAGLVAVPVGAIIAIPAVRLPGMFLALATFGFGILLEQAVYTQTFMFGPFQSGIPVTRPDLNLGVFNTNSDTGMFYVSLLLLVIASVIVVVITETRLGRMLRALGDSSLALETYGLSVPVTRVLVFCISAFLAAIAGALIASLNNFAIGSTFPSFNALTLFAVVIIVVAGDPWYALLAAASITIIPAYLTFGNINNYLDAIFGIGAILTPVFRDKIQGTPMAVRRWIDRVAAPRRSSGPEPLLAADGLFPAGPAAGHAPDGGQREGIALEDLVVRYGGVVAVDNVSLSAPVGRITGIIGPNGAGKTSMFNACSGLVRPSSGHVRLNSEDVSGYSPSGRARRGIGRTFQRVQLFESLSVRSNIELARECSIARANPLRHLFTARGDQEQISLAARQAIEMTGLAAHLDTPVRDLSTGLRRLVELARVLAGPFEVLLLDEPSSGLDQSETVRFGEILLRAVREKGLGVLIVEHDMALIRQICDHIYVLNFGHLIFEGGPADLLSSELVRDAYLGSTASVAVTPRPLAERLEETS
jgi:ABC-type branched-subunit amino acid transport system ATPase component/branched-subunit amino acid ABC-type transport system permease component